MRELPVPQQAPGGSASPDHFQLIFPRSQSGHSNGYGSPRTPEAFQTVLLQRWKERPQRTALDRQGVSLPIAVSFVPRKQSATSIRPPQCQVPILLPQEQLTCSRSEV